MQKKLFMTIMIGVVAVGVFYGGATPLTELPYEQLS